MFEMLIYIALGGVFISMLGLFYRVIKGPSIADRVIALDSIGISLISIVGLVSVLLRTSDYLEVILLIGILAFIGTVAFSKFIEKGEIIERDRNK
ncbi:MULTISPECIES: Na(+)/H(+) antiporter subunit F1 [unclassified Exiguobacterium]|uniref:Na(+)/H(+) antiporter subunit F1 n=2 Tax=unclassified Exiguobacterium TaxID=2644629 RepID=UPI000B58BFAB|nr:MULTISPECIES: Na(+)/H(+) antiporter subunit F1 [unclassified Exiguobacterium]ASI35564.1 Na(+)/H(+) antiporter subunit F [Exiguobacterium sp. N4-1P]ASI37573.1 Na(+)/H(+) antiporter subunit F [Exiguobacterium sp. N4-1P]